MTVACRDECLDRLHLKKLKENKLLRRLKGNVVIRRELDVRNFLCGYHAKEWKA